MEKKRFDVVPRFIIESRIDRIIQSTSYQKSTNKEKTSQILLNLPFSNVNVVSLSAMLMECIKENNISGNFAIKSSQSDGKNRPAEGSKIVLSCTLKDSDIQEA
jgi:hypothetical protein